MKIKEVKKTLDEFEIERTLGSGYTGKVKLGRSKKDDELYALKILDPTKKADEKDLILKSLQIEERFLKEVEHKNIVKFQGLVEKGVYRSKGRTKIVSYVILEYVPNGELFNILFHAEKLSENCARHYFGQLISAQKYLRSRSIAHRDIKPENLLLGKDMDLMLADFGFATTLDPENRSTTHVGTKSYMAPEVLAGKSSYDAVKSDTFSSGIVLFVMLMAKPPFTQASSKCQMYKLLQADRGQFFSIFETYVKCELSREAKELLGRLFDPDPEARPSFEEILESEWMVLPTDLAAARTEMTKKVEATRRCIELQNLEEELDRKSTKLVTRADMQNGDVNPFEKLKIEPDFQDSAPALRVKTPNLPLVLLELGARFKAEEKGELDLDEKNRLRFSNGNCQIKLKTSSEANGVFALSMHREMGEYFEFQELRRVFVRAVQALNAEVDS